MFAYCGNNPCVLVDQTGTISATTLESESSSLSAPWKGALGAGIAVLTVGVFLLARNQKDKPINLPAKKKVNLDTDHISSGHMPDGDRNPDGKKSVFWGMTFNEVIKAIYEAYSTASKLQTQGDRVKLVGYSNTYQIVIEMWLNIVTKTIETAYPK